MDSNITALTARTDVIVTGGPLDDAQTQPALRRQTNYFVIEPVLTVLVPRGSDFHPLKFLHFFVIILHAHNTLWRSVSDMGVTRICGSER